MYISANPLDAASNASKAGTSSPAANTLISSLPSVASLTLTAILSGEVPKPGRFLGHVVTIFNLLIFFEIDGVDSAEPITIDEAAPRRKFLLPNFIFFLIFFPEIKFKI